MVLPIDTVVGNKRPSGRLIGMLIDLYAIFDNIEEIRAHANNKGFSGTEIVSLLKNLSQITK
jgi:hypothetical protein